MDKATVYKEWLGATDEAILALADWRAQLTDWQARGGEAQPGDFDAAFRRLLNDGGLDGWADECTAGGGIDLLALIVKGGDVCPRCNGTGRGVFVFSTFQFETCETCGGLGAILPDPEQEEPDPRGDNASTLALEPIRGTLTPIKPDPRGDNASTLASSPCRHAEVYDVEVGE